MTPRSSLFDLVGPAAMVRSVRRHLAGGVHRELLYQPVGKSHRGRLASENRSTCLVCADQVETKPCPGRVRVEQNFLQCRLGVERRAFLVLHKRIQFL